MLADHILYTMNLLPVLPDRKFQLLQARIDGGVIENGVITSPPTVIDTKETTNNSTVATRLDIFASPKEVIQIDTNSNSSTGSRSNSRLSAKENRMKANSQSQEKLNSAKRPLEFDSNDSFDGFEEEKSAKQKKEDLLSPEPAEPEKVAAAG